MRERVAFLLGKDPALARGGDITLFRLLRSIAEERYDTEVICLSEQPDQVQRGVVRVAKPELRLPVLAARSAARRRSLVHTRFDVDGLRDAVERSAAHRYVAVHAYLAEPYLRSAGAAPEERLLVSNEVSEAPVWASRGPLGRVEARRLARDERRVLRAARGVASYDADEVAAHREAGLPSVWLPLTLPPAPQADVAATPPRLVLLGNRHWAPNAQAAQRMVELWPAVSAGIPDAELWLVGPRRDADVVTGPGIVDHGEVTDVGPLLAACRALVAPVDTGGGVRVKVLEAAARGLPVVSTPAGVGSIESLLGLTPADGDGFVARCRALLLDADLAAAEGGALYRSNTHHWQQRTGRDAVLDWLAS